MRNELLESLTESLHTCTSDLRMSKMVIGLTGSIGSGCTTAAQHLKGNGFRFISMSVDVLGHLAKEHKKPFATPQEKQDFGNFARRELREPFRDRLLEVVRQGEDKVVIESFRNPTEINFLRDEFPHFYLIALFAPKQLRQARKRLAPEIFEKIDRRDEEEKDNKLGQHVRRCVKNADMVLDNSAQWNTADDANDFFGKIDQLIRLLDSPFRAPTTEELLMHLAYSVSLHSHCIERQVGAVITDEQFRVVSTGYNDVPQGSETCYDLYSECYRKRRKRENLVGMKNFRCCFNCGEPLPAQEALPLGADTERRFTCVKCGSNLLSLIPGKELDYCRSLHAEENAILSNPYLSHRHPHEKRFILFSTTFPCMLCAKKIANSGIQRVLFVEPYPIEEARSILEENRVAVEAFQGVKSLSFNWIFRKRSKYLKETSTKRLRELRTLTGGTNG